MSGSGPRWASGKFAHPERMRMIEGLRASGACGNMFSIVWSYTTLVRWISEADDHRREIVLAGRQPVCRCILYLFSYLHYLMDVILILIII